ncbi:MAG: ArsA family ATPase [Cyanobacteria bacterium P01_E01_bin.6]
MALILTFLGKGEADRSAIAAAAAHRCASDGKRVLFLSQDVGPSVDILLGAELSDQPQSIAPNLSVMHLQTAKLLEKSWDELKRQEAQYLKTPFFKEVYGQELGVLPGMDQALALNALRDYDASGDYDVIVYDGDGQLNTLRMFGMPEILSWYLRRFRGVFANSDLGRTLSPFIQPVASAVLNVDWSGDIFSSQPANQANNMLDQGTAAVTNPQRVAAYLVTTNAPGAIATAKYLWGAAQQVGLTVGGVVLSQAYDAGVVGDTFSPLSVTAVSSQSNTSLTDLAVMLPSFNDASTAPAPMTVDLQARQVKLFLPGFTKQQVKLTQYGPEVTIEAGDQRRNVVLPSTLQGKPVAGAKFQDGYLIITFGN